MGNLFKNEMLKLKRSRSVKVLFWYFTLYSAIAAVFFAGGDGMEYGFTAPFQAFAASGSAGFFFFAALASGLAADEFSHGTIRNALSCGVDRRSYFTAKTCCLLGVTAFIYLCNVTVLCLVKNAVAPFAPDGFLYSRYWQKALVFNLAAILLTLCYMSLFICIACLCRRGVMTFVVSTLITLAETLLSPRPGGPQGKVGGPVFLMWEMTYMIRTDASSDRLLEADFFLALIPSLCMGAVSLAAAYQVFKRADIN